MYNIILSSRNKISNHLLNRILEYHPLFYKYKKEYYKILVYNTKILREIKLTPVEYEKIKIKNGCHQQIITSKGKLYYLLIIEMIINSKSRMSDGLNGLQYKN